MSMKDHTKANPSMKLNGSNDFVAKSIPILNLSIFYFMMLFEKILKAIISCLKIKHLSLEMDWLWFKSFPHVNFGEVSSITDLDKVV